MSFFLEIETVKAEEDTPIFSGELKLRSPVLCQCPNCEQPMFPVFTIKRAIAGLPQDEIYDEHGFITIDVCPSCSHSLQNYYVKNDGALRVAYFGFIDKLGPSNYIDQPFESRSVKLTPVPLHFWGDDDFLTKYFDRKLLAGVLHQLGGKKMKKERVPLEKCLCCGDKLTFFATVDYDDLNIPIYENQEARALIIGDMQSLNVFSCESCNALNYGITIG